MTAESQAATAPSSSRLRVWTDGACKGNPGPGGWAWVTEDGRNGSGGEIESTNQRMEIMAAAQAVKTFSGPLEIISDSTYVVSCFNKTWYRGWLARGWTNSQKKPVANRDLWEPFINEVLARGDVSFTWVKGHSGDRMNEKADILAVAAADEMASIAKASATAKLTGNDVVSAGSADGRIPPGWRLVVVGQRSLAGDDLRRANEQLDRILRGFAEMHDDLVVLTGLREGAELIGAEAARRVGVPYVAVLPWPNPVAGWKPDARRRFEDDLAQAKSTVVLEKKVPSDADAKRQSIRRRNGWLAKVAHGAIVIHDGVDPEGVAGLQQMAPLGDDVWDLDLRI